MLKMYHYNVLINALKVTAFLNLGWDDKKQDKYKTCQKSVFVLEMGKEKT